jgi:hypothetical protein
MAENLAEKFIDGYSLEEQLTAAGGALLQIAYNRALLLPEDRERIREGDFALGDFDFALNTGLNLRIKPTISLTVSELPAEMRFRQSSVRRSGYHHTFILPEEYGDPIVLEVRDAMAGHGEAPQRLISTDTDLGLEEAYGIWAHDYFMPIWRFVAEVNEKTITKP